MEIIDELETVRRGLYGGATGYLDFGGNMNFCITIRTMIKKGDYVYLQQTLSQSLNIWSAVIKLWHLPRHLLRRNSYDSFN